MKNVKIYSVFAFSFVISVACFFSVVQAQQDTYLYNNSIPPQFSRSMGAGALLSLQAANVTQTKATITGKAQRSTPSFDILVDTKLTGTFTDKFSPQVQSDGTFSYQLTGLSPAYTYHFLAVATGNDTTRLSAVNSFVTPAVDAKLYVSKLDDKSATIQATISEGAKNPAIIYSTQFGNLGTPVSMTLSNGIYSASLSGLKENTNYYYQLVGDSYQKPGTQVYYTAVMSFVTLPTVVAPTGTIPTIVGSDITGLNASGSTAISSSYNDGALVGCGTGGPLTAQGRQACGFPEAMALINRIINFLIFLVAPIIAVCVILYAGILILTAGGATENISKAKGMIWKVVIGLVIAMGAWLLVKSLLVALGVDTTVFPVFY